MAISGRRSGYVRLVRSGKSATLLSTVVAAATGATAGFVIWHEHQSALEEHHQHEMMSMGVILAGRTARHVQVIDLILREVETRVTVLSL